MKDCLFCMISNKKINTDIVFEQIRDICKTFNTTVMLATHDQRMKKFGDKFFNFRGIY